MNSNLIIVADRGNFKAYRLAPSAAGRAPHLELLETATRPEPHQKVTEIYTDQDGRFPAQTGAGSRQHMQGNSTSERHVDLEETRRSVRELASRITAILEQEKPNFWSFAAPGEIQNAILDELPASLRHLVSEQIPLDLVHTPPQQILKHFSPRHAFSAH